MKIAASGELIAFINDLADIARPIIRHYFRSGLAVDTKDDLSPVTRADREVEAAIVERISSSCPNDSIVGEETGFHKGTSDFTWVIDPIDGTKAFIVGKPQFGTLIALLHNDEPILGVIDQPITQERWLGAAGRKTTWNGMPISTSDCVTLKKARLGTSSPALFDSEEKKNFDRLAGATDFTAYGGDCYSYGLIALGTLDLVAEANLKLYDYAALIPIVEGAGGVITGWAGQKPGHDHDGHDHDGSILAAANPALHRAALAVLADSV